MATIRLRPEMKTAGGEVNDILVNGRFAGTMTLVYRDSDRISGSVQLDKQSLSEAEKQQVESFVQQFIQDAILALRAASCEVIVTYSRFDHIVSTDDFEYDWVEDDFYTGDEGIEENEQIEMLEEWQPSDDGESEAEPVYFELVVTKEGRSRIEYGICNRRRETVAAVEARIVSHEVNGDIRWESDPNDIEIEHATELLVSDFDENEIDTFVINHWFNGDVVETVELTHEDLLDDSESEQGIGYDAETDEDDEEYTVVLGRDDGDTLTYEIYQQSRGGLPIGTATVDISRRQLSGFIDFRELGDRIDHERIAAQLLRELDKEKDYQTVSLTMLYHNKPFDEIIFETEQIH
ncbi:hypothetical protein [Paenibacillus sp. MBLB4367]|uniref:hypothetical protein n=1 Tax=Paenibacillus sp. MBLB4367 TaxID=3384767 RepID=UPI0039081B76